MEIRDNPVVEINSNVHHAEWRYTKIVSNRLEFSQVFLLYSFLPILLFKSQRNLFTIFLPENFSIRYFHCAKNKDERINARNGINLSQHHYPSLNAQQSRWKMETGCWLEPWARKRKKKKYMENSHSAGSRPPLVCSFASASQDTRTFEHVSRNSIRNGLKFIASISSGLLFHLRLNDIPRILRKIILDVSLSRTCRVRNQSRRGSWPFASLKDAFRLVAEDNAAFQDKSDRSVFISKRTIV